MPLRIGGWGRSGMSRLFSLIACGAAILCLIDTAFADDVIYNGLHCNSLCQEWMGIGAKHPVLHKRRCLDVVAHPAQYDADLAQLCKSISGKLGR
jgi:hypothetical protein